MGFARFLNSPQEWTLFGLTAFWGSTFLVIRFAMQSCGPLWFCGLRFGMAAVIATVAALPVLKGLTRHEVITGSILAVSIFLGFALQTAGMSTITASKSAFITAFYVPLVPLCEMLVLRRRPGFAAWLGMALAFPGVLLLSGVEEGMMGGMGKGELLTLLGAAAFAIEIVLVGKFAPGTDPRRLAVIELSVTSALCFLCMPLTGESPAPFSWNVFASAAGLGIASAAIQSLMLWAQRDVPPTRASIIYATEPVWGGLFGYVAGERLTVFSLVGCVLVISGVLVSGRKGTDKSRAAKRG